MALRVRWSDRERLSITGVYGATALGASHPGEQGLSPLELLAASLGSCLAISLGSLMERRGLDRALLSLDVDWSTADRPSRITALRVAVDFGQPVDDSLAVALISAAERGCTVSNTIKHSAEVSVSLTPAQPNTA